MVIAIVKCLVKVMISNELIEKIKADLHMNKMLVKKYESSIDSLPKGGLHCKMINRKERYYHYSPHSSDESSNKLIYVSPKNELLLNSLIKKSFIERSLIYLRNNIVIEEAFLKKYKVFDDNMIINNMPLHCQKIAKSVIEFNPGLPSLSAWQQEKYDKNPYNPEGLKCRSQSGILVRSKSEAIILGQLESYDIPFRYEAHLELAGSSFYPDFTILNPKGNRIIYWEHFGMMDNPTYFASMEKKIRIYKECGIVQWINLIVTFETKETPLDGRTVNDIIKAFLLPNC